MSASARAHQASAAAYAADVARAYSQLGQAYIVHDLTQIALAVLLGKGPDLVAARWRVEAASKQIGASKTRFYPNLNLSAAAGTQALLGPAVLRHGDAALRLRHRQLPRRAQRRAAVAPGPGRRLCRRHPGSRAAFDFTHSLSQGIRNGHYFFCG